MKSINLQRTESLLMELIPEALSNLVDSRINSLPITAVNCKMESMMLLYILMALIMIKLKLKILFHC